VGIVSFDIWAVLVSNCSFIKVFVMGASWSLQGEFPYGLPPALGISGPLFFFLLQGNPLLPL
jgi:hypothetical protein